MGGAVLGLPAVCVGEDMSIMATRTPHRTSSVLVQLLVCLQCAPPLGALLLFHSNEVLDYPIKMVAMQRTWANLVVLVVR